MRLRTGLLSGTLKSKYAANIEHFGTSEGGEKKIRKDDKARSISEHVGTLPIVMVSPSDISMVSESGDERRRFVNAVLSQMDREYLTGMQQYNRLLQLRNRLLKDPGSDDALMDAYDERLSALATPLSERRRRFTEDLYPIIKEYYYSLSGGGEQVEVEYRSDLDKGDLLSILRSRREKDRMSGFTTAGLQRDDFIFTMEGYPIRRCGSQGQQKSFLVSLKFAQYDIMKKAYGFPPILLLDDLFDKLDMNRVSNLLGMVAGSEFGQIFITDSNKVRISGIVDSITEDRVYY